MRVVTLIPRSRHASILPHAERLDRRDLLASVVFADDFNRRDSDDAGNGWTQVGEVPLVIRNNELTSTVTPGFGGVYRPLDATAGPIEVTASIAEKTGWSGLPRQYGAEIGILNDGTVGSGYRVAFHRRDINFNNSAIVVFDGAREVGRFTPAIQFEAEIQVAVTFSTNGSISGTVQTGGRSFDFAFGARDIQSDGGYFIYGQEAPDPRASPSAYLFHRLDDLTITPVPEPSMAMACVALAGVLAARRRARN